MIGTFGHRSLGDTLGEAVVEDRLVASPLEWPWILQGEVEIGPTPKEERDTVGRLDTPDPCD